MVHQVWQRILGMIQETTWAKCEVDTPLESSERILMQGLSLDRDGPWKTQALEGGGLRIGKSSVMVDGHHHLLVS